MHTSAARPRAFWTVAAALTLSAALTGCSAPQKQSDASSYLIVNSLKAAPGGSTAGTLGDTLASDVLTAGVAWADVAQVELRLSMKDVTSPTGPSDVNAITVNRYHVKFTRTDNPAAAAPAAFDGAVTATITATTPSTISFTLVNAQAKTQAPLAALVGQAGAAISTIAEVTFYGADQVGRAVSVTGSIGVTFADWADPDAQPAVTTFTVTPASGLRVGQIAVFDASDSTAASGRTITSYAWDFGDGGTSSSANAFTSHVYTTVGAYTVTLTVTDSLGQTRTFAKIITVVP